MSILTAKQANEIANGKKNIRASEQLTKIMANIRVQCESGNFYCSIDQCPYPVNKAILEKAGYKIETGIQRNEFYGIIYWDERT